MSTLLDVVANLDSYDDELTIYVAKPWTCDSETVLAREQDQDRRPPEAEACGAEYFVEVFVAKDFLADWMAAEGRPTSERKQCERLIRYAIHDT